MPFQQSLYWLRAYCLATCKPFLSWAATCSQLSVEEVLFHQICRCSVPHLRACMHASKPLVPSLSAGLRHLAGKSRACSYRFLLRSINKLAHCQSCEYQHGSCQLFLCWQVNDLLLLCSGWHLAAAPVWQQRCGNECYSVATISTLTD